MKPQRLTRAALETLAIIAYRQPVTRPEIEDIRGVDCGAVVKALLERRLVKILGKKEEPGRPILYGTTQEFLEFFALKDLASLPTLREFHELSEEHRDIVEKQPEPPPTPAASPGSSRTSQDEKLRADLEAKRAESDAALEELEQAMEAADEKRAGAARGRARRRRRRTTTGDGRRRPPARHGASPWPSERLQKFLAQRRRRLAPQGGGAHRRRPREGERARGHGARDEGRPGPRPRHRGRPARLARARTRAYYLLYKPSGCVTTASDPEGRPTALEYLRGVKERVFPVGRLDFDAEGAVLFTDDGELANRLAHPRYGHQRTYLVKVKGDPEPEALERMIAGVRLEDGPGAGARGRPSTSAPRRTSGSASWSARGASTS